MYAPPCPTCGLEEAAVAWQEGDEIVWRCHRCTLQYRDPANQELGLSAEERADRLGYADFVDQHDVRVGLEAPRIRRLEGLLERYGIALHGASVLDVGAATGTLGIALGSGVDYVGLEPDPVLRARAPGELEILPTTVQDAELEAGRFDVVVLSDVLEHVSAPVEVLRRVHGWLRVGGLVYVEAPDESDLDRRAAWRKRLGLYGGLPTHPAHISLFTRHTLCEALDRAGYRRIDAWSVSIWGEAERLRMVAPMPRALARLASLGIAITGVDRALGQAALAAVGQVTDSFGGH